MVVVGKLATIVITYYRAYIRGSLNDAGIEAILSGASPHFSGNTTIIIAIARYTGSIDTVTDFVIIKVTNDTSMIVSFNAIGSLDGSTYATISYV